MATAISSFEPHKEASRHPHWALVERVSSSECFRTSARLREFLLYVCDCALRNAPEEATEQQIGIHVFQRRPGYNSSEDSIVRTHARGLRQKLAAYFQEEGLFEEIIIEIPKGHYLPVFHPRHQPLVEGPQPAADGKAVAAGAPAEKQGPSPDQTSPRYWPSHWLLWLVLGVLFVASASVAAWRSTHPAASAAHPISPVERFWMPFLADPSSMVIYSDALFTGNSTTGLRYAAPLAATAPLASGDYVDTYTGVGELASVYALTRLFDHYHSSFVLKRSLLVTWDQASQSNLIFIGSVAENPSLRLLPSTMNFTMIKGDGFAGFANHDPAPGEQPQYTRLEGRPGHPMTSDYALLALLPGPLPGKKVLVFSGLTTLGTESAVEFACRNSTVEQLLRRAEAGNGSGTIRPFEALLQTSIVGGVPMETHLVALHLH